MSPEPNTLPASGDPDDQVWQETKNEWINLIIVLYSLPQLNCVCLSADLLELLQMLSFNLKEDEGPEEEEEEEEEDK